MRGLFRALQSGLNIFLVFLASSLSCIKSVKVFGVRVWRFPEYWHEGPSVWRPHHSPACALIHLLPEQHKHEKKPGHREYKRCRLGGQRTPLSCQPHQWAPVASSPRRHGYKAVAKRKWAEGQRRFRRLLRGFGGREATGPKCERRHSSIRWSVGGTYGPIITAQWCHLMHTAALSQPPMWLCWKTLEAQDVRAWTLCSDGSSESWVAQGEAHKSIFWY